MVNNMDIQNFCENGDVLFTMRIVVTCLNIIRIVIPVIVAGGAIKSFFDAVVASSGEGLGKPLMLFIKRLIAAFLVFFVPTFLDLGLKMVSTSTQDYHACLDNATEEGIQNAYYKRAKDLIARARETFEPNDMRAIYKYLDKIEDESRKKEIENEVKKLQEFFQIRTEIERMSTIKVYKALKDKISKLSDTLIKNKLSEELEQAYKALNIHDVAQLNIGGTVTKKEETETLKVYVNRVNSYYVTQIWVEDPYKQLNKYDSPQYGSSLYKPSILLQGAINERGLSNKLIIGFNASGFYLRDTYDAASVNYYAPYDRTSVGTLVITNGKVVRNAYDKSYKTWFIAGVDTSGTFRIYTDERTNDVNAKKEWSNRVISDVRNTFTFASPLVIDGSASNITTSMPSPGSSLNRQAMCQIDKNNFILITGSNLSRGDLINIMLQAHCKTGTNFDGGGSIALLYKSKNSNNIETIIGNGRSLTEVGYFSEQ